MNEPRPRRGEVWWVDLEPTVGDEINKRRPAVVISGDEYGVLKTRLVAPLTTMTPSKAGKVWLVPIRSTRANGLAAESAVDVLQIRGVSTKRFANRAGNLSEDDLVEVVTALALVVGYE